MSYKATRSLLYGRKKRPVQRLFIRTGVIPFYHFVENVWPRSLFYLWGSVRLFLLYFSCWSSRSFHPLFVLYSFFLPLLSLFWVYVVLLFELWRLQCSPIFRNLFKPKRLYLLTRTLLIFDIRTLTRLKLLSSVPLPWSQRLDLVGLLLLINEILPVTVLQTSSVCFEGFRNYIELPSDADPDSLGQVSDRHWQVLIDLRVLTTTRRWTGVGVKKGGHRKYVCGLIVSTLNLECCKGIGLGKWPKEVRDWERKEKVGVEDVKGYKVRTQGLLSRVPRPWKVYDKPEESYGKKKKSTVSGYVGSHGSHIGSMGQTHWCGPTFVDETVIDRSPTRLRNWRESGKEAPIFIVHYNIPMYFSM